MWKAKIKEIRDIGNGTADVTVDYFDDINPEVSISRNYNFHASEDILEVARSQIISDLKSYKTFDDIKKTIGELVGSELTIE